MKHGHDDGDLRAVLGKLEGLNRLHGVLSRINRSIVRAEDPHELYEAATRIIAEDGGFACAWIVLLEPASERLVLAARAGAPADLDALPAFVAGSAEGECPVGMALRSNVPQVVDDVQADSRLVPAWRRVMGQAGARSLAAFPLPVEGQRAGALVVAAVDTACFRDEALHVLTELAEDISFALEGMRREERRIAAETRAHYLAHYDLHTGLPGPVLFGERLAAACEAAGGERLAVLAVNLRRYHAILQVLGQPAGVQLMRTLAARVEALVPTASIARITESEFAFLVEPPAANAVVEETARRVHAALAEAVPLNEQEVFLDPFIGIAFFPQDGAAADVLKAAQLAAAQGPRQARACFRFFAPDMGRVSRQHLDLDAALRRAVQRQEFVLHFQPQVDLGSGRVVGAEALLRWRRPDHGLIAPAQFMPLLENSSLIAPVGEWAMEEACRLARRWQDEGGEPFRVAVNLSARQFQEGDVEALVRRALDVSKLDPCWLEVEITESIVLLDAEAAIRCMNALREVGVTHALDDFGTGYSSLSYLQRLPVARLKIDHSFVSHLTSKPSDAAIVRAIIGMAHSLGVTVIAEGVETDGQLNFLRRLDCEEIQGYYFSRPLPTEDFLHLLRDKRSIAPSFSAPEHGRVLLLVGNDPAVLASLRQLLRQTEFRVLMATSAQEGFDLLASHRVCVVLCDENLLEMSGTEFLARTRELHPDAVRMILCRPAEHPWVVDALTSGTVYRSLEKPWDDARLIEAIRQAFRLYEMERRNQALSRMRDTAAPRAGSSASSDRDAPPMGSPD